MNAQQRVSKSQVTFQALIWWAFVLVIASSYSSLAAGSALVHEITLKRGILNPRAISADIVGYQANACSEIEGTHFSISPLVSGAQQIDLYLASNPVRDVLRVCAKVSRPFVSSIELGELEPGYYKFNIYDNQQLVLSRSLSVPLDVKSFDLGLKINNFVGSHISFNHCCEKS